AGVGARHGRPAVPAAAPRRRPVRGTPEAAKDVARRRTPGGLPGTARPDRLAAGTRRGGGRRGSQAVLPLVPAAPGSPVGGGRVPYRRFPGRRPLLLPGRRAGSRGPAGAAHPAARPAGRSAHGDPAPVPAEPPAVPAAVVLRPSRPGDRRGRRTRQ